MKVFICILAATAAFAGVSGAPCRAAETIRLAVQKTGTFAWELAVIRAHGLDRQANLAIQVNELASPEAGKIALRGAALISSSPIGYGCRASAGSAPN
jgi:NitT/TauT family transport system substrate-binding protein